MAEVFDPYHKWLGIPPEERPPTYYSLLGLKAFESDADVISNAADGRMAQVKSFQAGKHSAVSQRLLNEIAAAKVNLLDLKKKAVYDQQLRERLGAEANEGGTAGGVLVNLPFLEEPIIASRPAKAAGKSGKTKRRFPWYVPVAAACGVVLLGIIFTVVALQSTGPAGAERSKDMAEGKPRVTAGDHGATPASKKDLTPIETTPERVVPAKITEKLPPVDTEPPEKISKITVVPPQPKPDPQPVVEEKPEPREESRPKEKRDPEIDNPAPKQPYVPSEEEQKAAEARVRDIFKKEFAEAKTAETKLALAKSLLKQGTSVTDNSGERFVLWRMAAEQAAAAGGVSEVLAIVDKIAESYPISMLTLKGEMLAKMSETVRPGSAGASLASQIVEAALGLGQQAVAGDDFDTANRFLRLAGAVARRTKDTQLNHEVSARRTDWDRLRLKYSGVQKALDRLAEDSDDTDANLLAGRWFCFDKGDWDKGLPMLARGSNPQWAELAKREIANPDNPAQQLELADAWWALAEKQAGPDHPYLKGRAAVWYRKALPTLAGLDKVRVEKQLQRAGAAEEPSRGYSTSRGVLEKGNVALAIRGTRVDGTFFYGTPDVLIDGVSEPPEDRPGNKLAFAGSKIPCEWKIVFPKVYSLQLIRFRLWGKDDRFYRYVITTSIDGVKFVPLADRSQGKWRGWQDISFPARAVKVIKLIGLYNDTSEYFRAYEFEAYCIPTVRQPRTKQ